MTAPSAIELVAEVRRVGGSLTPNPDGTLGVDLPTPETKRLLPWLAERKPDLLILLRYPATPCPACDGDRFRPDAVGVWRCDRCEPETPPDPFGPLPAGKGDALAELELRAKLRQPALARITLSQPVVSGSVRVCQIAAASLIWAAGAPQVLARRRAESWAGIAPALVAGHRIAFTAPTGRPVPGEWVLTPVGTACEVLAHDADSGAVLVRALAAPRWQWCAAGELISEMDWEARA